MTKYESCENHILGTGHYLWTGGGRSESNDFLQKKFAAYSSLQHWSDHMVQTVQCHSVTLYGVALSEGMTLSTDGAIVIWVINLFQSLVAEVNPRGRGGGRGRGRGRGRGSQKRGGQGRGDVPPHAPQGHIPERSKSGRKITRKQYSADEYETWIAWTVLNIEIYWSW